MYHPNEIAIFILGLFIIVLMILMYKIICYAIDGKDKKLMRLERRYKKVDINRESRMVINRIDKN